MAVHCSVQELQTKERERVGNRRVHAAALGVSFLLGSCEDRRRKNLARKVGEGGEGNTNQGEK